MAAPDRGYLVLSDAPGFGIDLTGGYVEAAAVAV